MTTRPVRRSQHPDEVDRSHDAERIHAGACVRGSLRGRQAPRVTRPDARSVGAAAGPAGKKNRKPNRPLVAVWLWQKRRPAEA